MGVLGTLDGCLPAAAGHTSPARHEGYFPQGAAPTFVPARCLLPWAFAKLPVLCTAPLCVLHFQIGEWFSSAIPRFKQEPEANIFSVNGMLLATFMSIVYIQLDFGSSGLGLSMPDLKESK